MESISTREGLQNNLNRVFTGFAGYMAPPRFAALLGRLRATARTTGALIPALLQAEPARAIHIGLLAIHKLLKANSVTSCAVYLASPL